VPRFFRAEPAAQRLAAVEAGNGKRTAQRKVLKPNHSKPGRNGNTACCPGMLDALIMLCNDNRRRLFDTKVV
jgi:hypothetical protein